MHNKDILVTCIIPTYNREKLVVNAINSVINQSFEYWELIIIDDLSTDNTWEIINNYAKKDKRILCLKNSEKGANNARNLGIKMARGKYIAFLDDDDMSLPHRFECQYKVMHNSGARFIVSWYEIRDRLSGKLIRIDKKAHKSSEVGFPSRWMIEKSLLEEVEGFNPKMKAMQDVELSFRLAQKYVFAHHLEVVAIIYNTPDSTSSSSKAIIGKLQLIDEVGYIMQPVELAYWNLMIALDYYKKGNLEKAKKYFQDASNLRANKIISIAYYYFMLVHPNRFALLRKINRLIIIMCTQKFTFRSIKHPIVS